MMDGTRYSTAGEDVDEQRDVQEDLRVPAIGGHHRLTGSVLLSSITVCRFHVASVKLPRIGCRLGDSRPGVGMWCAGHGSALPQTVTPLQAT